MQSISINFYVRCVSSLPSKGGGADGADGADVESIVGGQVHDSQ